MKSPWQFDTDAKFDAFCRLIAAEMVRLFGVSEEEAIGRINQGWGGRGPSFHGDFEILYHELLNYWANLIYWGDATYWWITGDARKRLGLGQMEPRQYP